MVLLKKATSLDDAEGAMDALPAKDGCRSFEQPARGSRLNVAIPQTPGCFCARVLGEFSHAEADSNVADADVVAKELHSPRSFQFDSSLQGVEFAARSMVFTSPQVQSTGGRGDESESCRLVTVFDVDDVVSTIRPESACFLGSEPKGNCWSAPCTNCAL